MQSIMLTVVKFQCYICSPRPSKAAEGGCRTCGRGRLWSNAKNNCGYTASWKQCGRGAEVERHRRQGWGAAGVEGGGVWGKGLGRGIWGDVPPSQILFLALKMVSFSAFWVVFWQLSCLFIAITSCRLTHQLPIPDVDVLTHTVWVIGRRRWTPIYGMISYHI